jgi:polyketide cyclase/dehydrase/lipid transport protein
VPIHWENTMLVDRPIDEIWAIFLDLFNTPRLPGGSMTIRQTSPGPMSLGSTAEGRRIVLGIEMRIIEKVVGWDPPNVLEVTIESRAFRAFERFTLVAGPDGTTCTDALDIELLQPLKLIGPLIEPFYRRQRRAQMRQTQELLEAGFR